jgi:hypothetical protein
MQFAIGSVMTKVARNSCADECQQVTLLPRPMGSVISRAWETLLLARHFFKNACQFPAMTACTSVQTLTLSSLLSRSAWSSLSSIPTHNHFPVTHQSFFPAFPLRDQKMHKFSYLWPRLPQALKRQRNVFS